MDIDLDFGRAIGIGDVPITFVKEEAEAYATKFTLTEGYNLTRTRNPEDDTLVLLIESDVENVIDNVPVTIKTVLTAKKRPSHVRIAGKIYTIDYGDLPIGDEEIITLQIAGTGERNAG